MYSLLFLGSISFLLSLILTPLVRNTFRRLGIVDHPGEDRRVHQHPIPRVGGVAIIISYLLAFACLLIVRLSAGRIVWESLYSALRLFTAAGLVFVLGLVDDLKGLKPWQKLIGETIAAGLAFGAGVHVHGFGGHEMGGWWSLPLTVIWLVACTNAVNLIDGIDGLAAGVGLFATSTIVLAALLQHNMVLALATIPLAGCLLGFIRFNFNPATIFLGDCGSLFIGFLLGCFGVLWSQKAATILGMTAPLMALCIPLLDTSLAIARRFLRRQSIFAADRGHIHHRLLDRGLTPRKVVLVLYGFCALGATCSLFMMNKNVSGFVIVVFCLITWIGIQHLGYVEFGVASRMFMEGAFRRLLNSQISLKSYEERLINAATPDECWGTIQSASKDFGFHRAHALLAGRTFDWQDGVQPMNSWDMNIPISNSDFVRLTRSFGAGGQANVIAPFADMLHATIGPKLPVFRASNLRPAKYQVAGHDDR